MLVKTIASTEFGESAVIAKIDFALHADRVGIRTAAVAVELAEGPGLSPALTAGKPVPVTRPPHTLADGMTPPFVGALPLEIAREAVDEIVLVTESEIIEGMRLLMTRAKLYVEGSGAATVAALVAGKAKLPADSRVVAIVSGGNVDLDRMAAALG